MDSINSTSDKSQSLPLTAERTDSFTLMITLFDNVTMMLVSVLNGIWLPVSMFWFRKNTIGANVHLAFFLWLYFFKIQLKENP